MATQTIEFRAPTAQAVTAKLFAIGSDTQVASASATEATNRKGTYAAAFTDVAAGTYDLIAFVSITPVARWFVKLTLTTATFQATDTATVESAISALQGADGDTLETLSDQIDGLSTSTGSGARTVTITVNDGAAVLQNAKVRLTEGVNTYTGSTNASGVIVFNVDDATYTVGITKSGYTYAGTTLIVDGTETRTYSMTVVSVTPPDDPALCAVTMHVYDQYGADMASQPVEITFVKWESTATDTPPVLSVPPVETTDVNGIVNVDLFRKAVYKIVYGNAPYTRRVDVIIPDAGSYTVEL